MVFKKSFKNGEKIHYSVGAIIRKNGKFLLIDRKKQPLGFASIAGHVDEGETPDQALIREVKEETGLDVLSSIFLMKEMISLEPCRRGIGHHNWYVYEIEYSGEPQIDKSEAKSLGWYDLKDVDYFEKAWEYIFKKLNYL